MKWLLNLFKENKTPSGATKDTSVPAGHVVVPIDWVRKPGEQARLRSLRSTLESAEKTQELATFAKYLKGILD